MTALRPRHLQPGDMLRIDTPAGPRRVQVTHIPAPYPPVVRALRGTSDETAFVVMADVRPGDARVTHLGAAPIPKNAQAFPTFRLAVRDRTGAPVYWWHWDGDGLRLAPEGADTALPLREVTPFETLVTALAET